jgi:hydrogenase expression/formation protein HypC
MCLVLPARVLAVNGQQAEVELVDGMRATVSLALKPEAAVGQYVVVDRGLVLEIIEAAEAEAILKLYEEIGQMWDEVDAAALLGESAGTESAGAEPEPSVASAEAGYRHG